MASVRQTGASQAPVRIAIRLTLATLVLPSFAQAIEFDAQGLLTVGAQHASAQSSWLEQGLGRYLADGATEPSLQSHLGLHWSSDLSWNALVHLRADTREGSGAALGLAEARFAKHWFLADDRRFTLTAGQMFLPTSREAIDPLWQSRYTLNLSALNSWIAEEIRPLGIQAALRSAAERDYSWELGVLGFGGNDSAGALLAWRGFALHDRLSVATEDLSLPRLQSLGDTGAFAGQKDSGTRPFGRDLDGRIGMAAHGHWGRGEFWQLRGALVDTRGDRDLHRGEYAWDTRFSVVGADWQVHPQWQLATEWMRGRSGMGSADRPAQVDIDFNAFYALASWAASETWRWSLRWERFEIQDRDGSAAEDNSDEGDGVTLTAFWTPRTDWRFAAEWSDIASDHAAAADLGLPRETAGRSVRVEARYYFDL
jgi:hypothetical protein